MRKNHLLISLISFALLLSFFTGCKKEKLLLAGSYKLDFSQDTVLFDTIFTTIGSTTHNFKLYNNHNGTLNISSIHLGQGTSSQFRINVDGESGVNFKDIEVEPNDSLFIFVEVTIDPNNSNTPLVVEDLIHFNTNGNDQQVVLNAWGQDAYFHVNEIITTDEVWNNDKPHVIYNYCAVDSAKSLTIPAGTTVHGHNSAVLFVYKSALHVNGSLGNPVVFKQDRLEDYLLSPTDSVAGQWRGIRFFEARTSNIDYTEIKNATIGVQIDTNTFGEFVSMNAVRIDNSVFAAIVTQGGNINATNCLFGSSGSYSGLITIGGDVNFDHCTFGNYWSSSRNTALFSFTDYYETNSSIQYRPFTNANFTNSIIYGPNDNELILDTLDRAISGVAPVYNFTNCIIKTDETPSLFVPTNNFYNCKLNNDPLFVSPGFWDFHVPSNSPAVGEADGSTLPDDLDGVSRSLNTIGCYEAQ